MGAIRSIPFAVALSIGVACAGAARDPVGVTSLDSPVKEAPFASGSGSGSAKAWPLFAAAKGWSKANGKRFVSTGHLFGRYEADIRVNETAKDSYAALAPGAALPSGAKIAIVLGGEGSAPGPLFAMEKEASGWQYVETDARGTLLRRGRLSPCVECHAHVADQDELFGVPLTGR